MSRRRMSTKEPPVKPPETWRGLKTEYSSRYSNEAHGYFVWSLVDERGLTPWEVSHSSAEHDKSDDPERETYWNARCIGDDQDDLLTSPDCKAATAEQALEKALAYTVKLRVDGEAELIQQLESVRNDLEWVLNRREALKSIGMSRAADQKLLDLLKELGHV
jgi:hypothetical protein